MLEGKSRMIWGAVSEILALIAEVNRDRKKRSRPFSGRDFNPFSREMPEVVQKGSISDLKIFVRQGKGAKT